VIKPLIPPAKRGGNKRTVDERELVKGLMYILSVAFGVDAADGVTVVAERRLGDGAQGSDDFGVGFGLVRGDPLQRGAEADGHL
jgi:hypothetical protein